MKKLTLKINKNIILVTPKTVSHSLVSEIYRKTLIHADKNSPELPDLIPKRDLTCPLPIVIAAAVVNPAVTGIEMNCTIKPGKITKN